MASMTIPGKAPSTPASHEPAVEPGTPSSNSCVSSPRYQTLPASSCANQSSVSSIITSSRYAVSRTTSASTSQTRLVSASTETSMRSSPSSVIASMTQLAPTGMGNHAFVTMDERSPGSTSGSYGSFGPNGTGSS